MKTGSNFKTATNTGEKGRALAMASNRQRGQGGPVRPSLSSSQETGRCQGARKGTSLHGDWREQQTKPGFLAEGFSKEHRKCNRLQLDVLLPSKTGKAQMLLHCPESVG